MKNEDEGIRSVREVRVKISAEFGNDPDRLVEHYVLQQVQYGDRLLRPAAADHGDAANDASRRR
jgi:hypothetical protein